MSIRSIRWFLINQINDEPDLYGLGLTLPSFILKKLASFCQTQVLPASFQLDLGISSTTCLVRHEATSRATSRVRHSWRFWWKYVKIRKLNVTLVSYHLPFLDSIRAHKGLHLKSLASTSGEEFRPVRWCRIVNTSSPARTSRSPFSCALVEVQDDFHHPDIASHGIGRWAVVSVLQLSHKKKRLWFHDVSRWSYKTAIFCPHFQSQLCVRLDSVNCKSEVLNIFYFPFHIWDVILPIHELNIFQDG